MARPSLSGGVVAVGHDRIRFDFTFDGRRYRLVKRIVPTEENLARARHYLAYINQQIAAGTFDFAKEFPDYAASSHSGRIPVSAQTCSHVFDAFLHHYEAMVRRGQIRQATVDAHRQILNRNWRPHIGDRLFKSITASQLDEIADRERWSAKTYRNAIGSIRCAFKFASRDFPERQNPADTLRYPKIRKQQKDPFSIQDAERLIQQLHTMWGEAEGNFHELRFFTGMRPCEEIALLVDDYDRANGVLNVTKTRVRGRARLTTKNRKDRRVQLCPRAIAVIERQLRLRAQFVARGLIEHDCLFFTEAGAPIFALSAIGRRWACAFKNLSIRYRRQYVARHTSVSWQLALGFPGTWVAEQHGHSEITMLTTYAAWPRNTQLHDIEAIRRARNSTVSTAEHLSNTNSISTPAEVTP